MSAAANVSSPRETQYLDTKDAYDQWSEVYDGDGNFLQGLDTLEMRILLPDFLAQVTTRQEDGSVKVVDLGCGTGRNTVSLIKAMPDAQVVGLELSDKMLDLAREKVAALTAEAGRENLPDYGRRVSLEAYNMLESPVAPISAQEADGVISTLVLEHVPTNDFFRAVSGMLKPGGVLLMTNMHSEMGGISQAGFVHPVTGVKVRPTSYAHTVAEVIEAANAAGFQLVSEVKERAVDADLAKELGPRAVKWIGVQVWYGGLFKKG